MANTFLATSELDFNTLKNNFKTFLQSQERFTDYDFEGSNFAVLLDILTYNTYLNSYYLNMIGSEMFLDTALVKESVVSHAKELNYIPRSRASAVAEVTVSTTAPSVGSIVTLPKHYRFEAAVGGTTYTFTTNNAVVITANSGTYESGSFNIYEGEIVTEYFNVTGDTTQRYILQSENLDSTSFEVDLYNANTDTTSYAYTNAPNLYGLTPSSNVFFVQGYANNQYEITFGNNVTGRNPQSGNLVKVTYRDTIGDIVNGITTFNATSSVGGASVSSVAVSSAAAGGAEREGLESIRFNAPRFFTTQERAVTKEDYINLTKAKYPQLQAVTAYGGEEVEPKQYGKVIISAKPYGTEGLISQTLKDSIIAYLRLKNLTTEPVFKDPEYIYAQIVSSVKYNPNNTTNSPQQLISDIKNSIVAFNSAYLTDFGADVSFSKLLKAIDDTNTSIIGNTTKLQASKRWSPNVQTTEIITFTFSNPLYYEDTLYQLPAGHETVINSTAFQYDYNGTLYTTYLSDDGLGSIYVYSFVPDRDGNATSTRQILTRDVGTVNYTTGDVTLALNIYGYTGNYINIYGKLNDSDADLMATRNMFIIIDASDISINMVAVR
jgi:hypothetical protein